MESRIRERFNDDILKEVMARYGIARGEVELLDGFESFIYEGKVGDEASILRIGHSLRRTPQLIQAEVDWINYLAEGGAGVAKALFSRHGNLVEAVDDGQGGQFLVTAFLKAPGWIPRRADRTPAFYERYGRLIGRIHALSRHYTPPHPDCLRFVWNDDVNTEVEEFLPPEDECIAMHFRALMSYLNALPTTPEGYGMIHQDAHLANLFVDESGKITLFDFDDCCYGHYIYDLAMVVFYVITNSDDLAASVRAFLPSFMRGYRSENSLNQAWMKEIPYFLKLREIDLYAMIHRSMGPGPYDDPWVREFMTDRRERLVANLPYVDFNFEGV
jgi:Ser/Thr protein kinase RdoA (MazF antagonist)